MTAIVLVLFAFAPGSVAIDHVEIAELNHVICQFDGSEQGVFWVWWRWQTVDGLADYYVADWRRLADAPRPTGGAQEFWDAKAKLRRRVESRVSIETWCFYDRESEDRKRLPESRRKKLTGPTIQIGDRTVGDGHRCYVIAELGINHNGDRSVLRRLISAAAYAGAQAIKFQKRTVDVVYSAEELAKPRESPFGATNGDLKRRLELGHAEYAFIDLTCRELGIAWFASSWDLDSVDFIDRFNPPCHKIASASITDLELIRRVCETDKPLIMSTGMCTLEELDRATDLVKSQGNPLALLHCVSTYPARDQDLNLRMIDTLRQYDCPVGYSGHERGIATTVSAVDKWGACIVERHLTLDRSMFGSDQAASLEPEGFRRMVRDIGAVKSAQGDGVKRVLDAEIPIQRKLRRVAV